MSKKTTKIILFAVIFIAIMIFSMNDASAYSYDYSELEGKHQSNGTVTLNSDVFNSMGTGVIYCVESGTQFPSNLQYHVSKKFEAKEPVFTYILAKDGLYKDLTGTDYGYAGSGWQHRNLRQNLIWRYLGTVISDDTNQIRSTNSYNKHVWSDNSDYKSLLFKNEFVAEWNAAEKYRTRTINRGLTIRSITENGDNIKVVVSGCVDNFDLLWWDYSKNEYKKFNTYDKSNEDFFSTTINIPKSEFKKDTTYNENEYEYYVKALGTMKVYKAEYYVLSSGSGQDLIAKKSWFDNATSDARGSLKISIEPKVEDVSLQKYIVDVNGNKITENRSGLKQKKEDNYVEPYKDFLTVHTEEEKIKLQESNNAKEVNPVRVPLGSTVTYRIWVYNNGTSTVNKVKILDTLPLASNIHVENSGSLKDSLNRNITYTKEEHKMDGVPYDKTITFTIDNKLEPGDKFYFDVTVKFSLHAEHVGYGIKCNEAKIIEIKSEDPNVKKTANYRQIDGDYVDMQPYKEFVSLNLEKYISKIVDAKGNDVSKDSAPSHELYNDNDDGTSSNVEEIVRWGCRYHTNAKEEKNKNTWKQKHPAIVRKGDKVTFTIKITNTGEYPIRITKLWDECSDISAIERIGTIKVNDEEAKFIEKTGKNRNNNRV